MSWMSWSSDEAWKVDGHQGKAQVLGSDSCCKWRWPFCNPYSCSLHWLSLSWRGCPWLWISLDIPNQMMISFSCNNLWGQSRSMSCALRQPLFFLLLWPGYLEAAISILRFSMKRCFPRMWIVCYMAGNWWYLGCMQKPPVRWHSRKSVFPVILASAHVWRESPFFTPGGFSSILPCLIFFLHIFYFTWLAMAVKFMNGMHEWQLCWWKARDSRCYLSQHWVIRKIAGSFEQVSGWGREIDGVLQLHRSWKAKCFVKGLEIMKSVADVAEAEGRLNDLWSIVSDLL